MWSQLITKKRIVALPLLAILLVNVAFAGTAAAQPRIWVGSADLEQESVLVGETVGVEVNMHNRGDGGVLGVSVEANGSEMTSERIHVEEDSNKQAVINVSFDEPGTYRIVAGGKTAGTVTVTQMLASSVAEREDGQTVRIRAGGLESGEPTSVNMPDSESQSFAVERVTLTGPNSSFNRSVATYAPPDGASFSVPSGDGVSIVGAVEMDSSADSETTSIRVGVDRDLISENDLQADEVSVYGNANGSFTPLDTRQVTTSEDRVVYEAVTDGGSQFIVGALTPEFDVRSTDLSTESAAGGRLITLTATIANDGQVTGEYPAEMRVDGVTVDEVNVTLRPGQSETVTLQHTLTSEGEYEVGLGDESVRSVVLTSDAVSGTENADGSESASGENSSGESILDAEPSLPSLDDVGALELGIGAGIVLLGGSLLLIFRP